MKLQLNRTIFILLCVFVALSLVQAAGAAEPGAAPLNTDFIQSFDEEHTTPIEILWTDTESQNADADEWGNHTNTSLDTNVSITAFITDALRVPSDNYPTIQSAVDAASPGATIIVESGTYFENVAITTPLTLQGTDTGDGFPVIDACGIGTGITIEAAGAVLDRLSVTNSGNKNKDAGVLITGANVTLLNISASTSRTGFSLDKSYNCTLVDCNTHNNSMAGISIKSSKGSVLTRCTSHDNYDGFQIDNEWYFYDSANARNSDSIQTFMNDGEVDIPSVFCDDMNEFPELTDKEGYVASFTQQKDLIECSTVQTSVFDLPYPSATYGEPGQITLFQCIAVNNSWAGIKMKGGDNTLTNCIFSNNKGYGIETFHAWNNTVAGCTLFDNGDCGLALYYSNYCTLSENTMAGNRFNFYLCGPEYQHYIDETNTIDGKKLYYLLNAIGNPVGDFIDAGAIYAINCRNLEIRDLNISGNQYAVYFINTSDSTLDNIHARENGNGICLISSDQNRITDCTAYDNSYSGISLSCSEGCTLTGNIMDGNYRNFCLTGRNESEYHHYVDLNNTVCGKPIYYLLNATGNPADEFANAGTIYAINCRDLEIKDQTLSNNQNGIFLMNTTDSILDHVCATDNPVGINIVNSNNCSIYNSNIENNLDGIIFSKTERNMLINCMVLDNIRGITLSLSTNSTLCMNTISNNAAKEYYFQDNLWNSPGPLTYLYGERMYRHSSRMGNYWGAAYSGTDQNGDGIGDTPYTGNGFIDNYPLMAPLDAYIFADDTDTDDGNDAGNGHVGAAGNLNAGDTVTMQFDETAVTGVTITAAGRINTIVVTVAPVAEGPHGLNGPVYQYLEADLIHAADDTIAEADFTFSVPKAWLTAHALTPTDVALWRFHDGLWISLLTEVFGEEGDNIAYRAVSPGFSYFAIGEGETVISPVETTPRAGAKTETGTIPAPVIESTAEPVVPSETADEAAATVTPPQQSPAGFGTLLAGVGTAAMLFRRH